MVDVLLGVEPAYNASEVCEIYDQKEKMDQSEDAIESRDSTDQPRDSVYKSRDSVDKSRDLENLNGIFTNDEIGMLKDLNLISYVNDVISNPNVLFTLSKSNAKALHAARNKLMYNKAARDIVNYEGTYGSFLYENVTITNHSSCEGCLYMVYGRGQYILEPTAVKDSFIGFGGVGYLVAVTAKFSGEDEYGNAIYMEIPFLEPKIPPVFQRGLLMSEAPLPRNDLCVPAY